MTLLAATRRVREDRGPHESVVRSEPQRALTLVQAALGGALTEAAFPDRGWWPAGFAGIALLVLALRRDSTRWAFVVGGIWGLAFFLLHVRWAQEAAGGLAWVALASIQAVLVAAGAAGWVCARSARGAASNHVWHGVTFVLIWVATEQLRSGWPFGGFPWGRLAFSQTDGPLVRLAWLGGAPLVSAAVAAGGYLLAVAWVSVRRGKVARAAGGAALVLAMPLTALAVPLATNAESGSLRVAAVQGNVPDAEDADRAWVVLKNHADGTLDLAEAAETDPLDLVVWPENASDIDPRADAAAASLIDAAAAAVNAPILVGANRFVDAGRYNDMVLWEDGRGAVFSYAKQRPAAFGEYVPLRWLVRLFSDEVDRVSIDMLPGSEPAVVPLVSDRLGRQVMLGTVICFEVAYDSIVRDSVLAGAEVLIVPTNNASFGWSPQSTQQLAMSRLRAIEHGRATLQVSTVGVSAVIAPDGLVQQSTGLFTADEVVATVPLRTSLTPADRLGPVPATAVILLAVGAVLLGLLRRCRSSSRG